MQETTSGHQRQDILADWARRVLIAGTVASFALMAAGLACAAIVGLRGGAADLLPSRLLPGLLAGQPASLVGIGIIAMLLTPAVNVLILVPIFLRLKERLSALIATSVLVVVAASVALALG